MVNMYICILHGYETDMNPYFLSVSVIVSCVSWRENFPKFAAVCFQRCVWHCTLKLYIFRCTLYRNDKFAFRILHAYIFYVLRRFNYSISITVALAQSSKAFASYAATDLSRKNRL